MSTPIEIETTILGGLPVIVKAQIAPAEPDVGIMYSYPEDVQIFWIGKKLREIPQSVYDRISEKGNKLLDEQLMESYNYDDDR